MGKKPNGFERFTSWLTENSAELEDKLPKGRTLDDAKRLSLYLLKQDARNNGKLSKARPRSLYQAILRAWHLDLDLDLGDAHLVAYGQEVELQVDYKGLIKLAKRGGECVHVKADVVREGDHCEYSRGTDAQDRYFVHTPKPFNTAPIIGAYALFHLSTTGEVDFEVMNRDQIDTVRSKAAKGSMMWNDFYGEGARKAVIRRGLKTLDLVPEDKRLLLESARRQFDFSQQNNRPVDLNERFSQGAPQPSQPKALTHEDNLGQIFDDEDEREPATVSAGGESDEEITV